MKQQAEIFEKIYQDYLFQLKSLDFENISLKAGLKNSDDALMIPFFGESYRVSSQGILNAAGARPSHIISVILCKYLLLYPEKEPKKQEWVSYKDFKDTAPFAEGFLNNVERPIARHFSGKADALRKTCKASGGKPPDIKLSYEVSAEFDALPKLPVLLLFNDADDDFPADCKVLFKGDAEKYLDPECLAMVGMCLSESLKKGLQKGLQKIFSKSRYIV